MSTITVNAEEDTGLKTVFGSISTEWLLCINTKDNDVEITLSKVWVIV
jgi:hypothetical protein